MQNLLMILSLSSTYNHANQKMKKVNFISMAFPGDAFFARIKYKYPTIYDAEAQIRTTCWGALGNYYCTTQLRIIKNAENVFIVFDGLKVSLRRNNL